ncbi:MAG: hypothetical protein RIS88_2794 [Pseudomonadota bacterium]
MSTEQVGAIEYVASIELQQFVRDQRRLSAGLGEVEKDGGRFTATLTKVAAAVNVLAAAMAAVKVARMADEFRTLEARVSVVAGNVEAGAAAFKALNDISTRTQTAVASNVELFTRLNSAIVQLGGTQADTLRVTELVSKAIKVSGASAAEAASAQVQFAQALGSGKLAGDELKSLLESSPYLMRQLADSMGVPVGALKKMGEEGELTSQRVIEALGKAAGRISADFEKIPPTIEGSMQVARDAASRAAVEFDKLSGGSTALTGTIKGVGDVLDRLAVQFAVASGAGDELGKNDAVSAWAKETRTALSYVVDAADIAWQTLSVLGRNVAFVFKGVGTEIGGIGAQIAAVMRGDFAGAKAIGDEMKRDAEQRRKELDAADAATLSRAQTMGAKMRQAWAAGQADYSNEGRTAGPKAGGPLPTGPADSGKGHKFDAEAYLASLRQASLQGLALVDEREKNQLATAQKHYAQGEINLQQHEAAKTEIMRAAEAERSKIYQQNQDAALAAAEQKRRDIEEAAKAQAEAEKAEADKRGQGQAMAQDLIIGEDPVAKLQAELEAKSALLAQYAALDQANLELYAQAKVALEQQTAEKIAAIKEQQRQQEMALIGAQLQNTAYLFDSMAGLAAAFGGKQSGVYKAMFAASKAFAIADATVKLYAAATQAMADPSALTLPQKLANYGAVLSAGAGLLNQIKGATFGGGRQYGGPVDAGTMYRVNETGRPEMFTARSGEQYMLPTKNGKVTPANKVGQGGQAVARANDGPVNINLKGVAMPNGMFAINPGDLADAIRQARRDMFL